MALKSNFNDNRFSKETQVQVDSLYQRVIQSFMRAGEKFVTDAREQVQDHAQGTYVDQTTNLRNSIAYFIYHDGKQVMDNQKGNAVDNLQKIKDIIKPKGIQLIGIAGMNYASYVESKGYNVISYQADTCIVELAYYLEHLDILEKGTAARFEESFVPGELPPLINN